MRSDSTATAAPLLYVVLLSSIVMVLLAVVQQKAQSVHSAVYSCPTTAGGFIVTPLMPEHYDATIQAWKGYPHYFRNLSIVDVSSGCRLQVVEKDFDSTITTAVYYCDRKRCCEFESNSACTEKEKRQFRDSFAIYCYHDEKTVDYVTAKIVALWTYLLS